MSKKKSFSSELREELISLKMWDNSPKINQEEQLAKLYLREAFIKSGFITDPEKEYHLEILFKEKRKSEKIQTILNHFGIKNNTTKKANDIMVYIKEAEGISTFLALIGAEDSVLRFEEIRVIKDAKNNINRLINCETANFNKIMNSSKKQIEDINLLKEKKVFNNLDEELKEIANLRVENPESSYEEHLDKTIQCSMKLCELFKPGSKKDIRKKMITYCEPLFSPWEKSVFNDLKEIIDDEELFG